MQESVNSSSQNQAARSQEPKSTSKLQAIKWLSTEAHDALRNGDTARVLELLPNPGRAIRIAPSETVVELLLCRSMALKIEGEFDKSFKELKKAALLCPEKSAAIGLRAQVASELGEQLVLRNEAATGEPLLRESIELLRKMKQLSHKRMITDEGAEELHNNGIRARLSVSYHRLADCCEKLENPTGALSCFGRAIALRRGLEGPDSPSVKELQKECADFLARSGKPGAAIAQYEFQFQRIWTRYGGVMASAPVPERNEVASVLISIADCLVTLKDSDQARVELKRAHDVMALLPPQNYELLSQYYAAKSRLEHFDGHYPLALKLLGKSIVAELSKPDCGIMEAELRLDAAATLMQNGEECEDEFGYLLKKLGRLDGKPAANAFRVLAEEAETVSQVSGHELAFDMRTLALEIGAKMLDPNTVDVAALELQTAESALELGDLDTADKLLESAHEHFPAVRSEYVPFLLNHAKTALYVEYAHSNPHPEKVEALTKKVIRLEKRAGDGGEEVELNYLRRLSEFYLDIELPEEADRILGDIREIDVGLDMAINHERALRALNLQMYAEVEADRGGIFAARHFYEKLFDPSLRLADTLQELNSFGAIAAYDSAGFFYIEQFKQSHDRADLRIALRTLNAAHKISEDMGISRDEIDLRRVEALAVALFGAGKIGYSSRLFALAYKIKESLGLTGDSDAADVDEQ